MNCLLVSAVYNRRPHVALDLKGFSMDMVKLRQTTLSGIINSLKRNCEDLPGSCRQIYKKMKVAHD